MDLGGKTILMVVAPNDFRDEEYFEPKEFFEAQGAKVITASTMPLSTSKAGVTVKIDQMLGEIVSVDYDAVVFVGGSGASVYLAMVKAHKIARDYADAGKVVGAICMAPSILANAGLLEGKRATSFADEKKNLIQRGALFEDKDVVRDGLLITANGFAASRAFAEAVGSALKA